VNSVQAVVRTEVGLRAGGAETVARRPELPEAARHRESGNVVFTSARAEYVSVRELDPLVALALEASARSLLHVARRRSVSPRESPCLSGTTISCRPHDNCRHETTTRLSLDHASRSAFVSTVLVGRTGVPQRSGVCESRLDVLGAVQADHL
jgi:hypothetical protein